MAEKESLWRDKYTSPAEYYLDPKNFNPEYFKFTKYSLEIDPDETVEDYENYDINRQRLEIAKCALDFFYFASKYAKILHPKRGAIRFVCYAYQHRVVENFEKYRFNLISKFRQGGLTTLAELWCLWRCMFKLDQQIVLLSKTDTEAITAGEIVNTAVKNLPKWLKPKADGKWNDHQKHFPDTGGKMTFGTPERARGLAITYLIVDEAAFIPEMDKHWKAIYPTLSTGGNCIVVSTVNGLGNWYEKMYHKSKRAGKPFNIIDLDYKEHPEYNVPSWVADQKAQLGEKGWLQEVLRSFLGSGETYIPTSIIPHLVESTQNNPPKRKLFKKWVNKELQEEDDGDYVEEYDTSWETEGAMWVWKEPIDGHEYTIGVDTAEGVGSDGDNSVIEVFDNATLEQVAEFYSNCIQPYQFTQVLNEIAIYYNHALVIVEGNGSGGAVLTNLQHHLFYDNLYFEKGGSKTPKPGIKVTVGNRLTVLEALQQRCINGTIKINSKRLVQEINTFVHNPQTGKIGAVKGEHDDAIMAVAISLFVRDSVLRDLPMGSSVPRELTEPLKSASYAEIKKEILDGAPRDFFDTTTSNRKENSLFVADEEIMAGVAFDFRRKLDSLLKEFGWIVFWAILLVK
jgi:hypothetical protein